MNDYAKLRIALQRIASGKNENGELLSTAHAITIATATLLLTADTVEEHIYLWWGMPGVLPSLQDQ